MNGFIDEWPDMVPFTYSKGGQDWTGQCRYGKFQSPIDIPEDFTRIQVVSAANSSFSPYFSHMKPIPTAALYRVEAFGFFTWLIFNNSLSEVSGPNRINHTLVDVRITAPSEHTLLGQRYPLSMHIVFAVRHPDRNFFVTLYMQVMYREGRRSALLDTLEEMQGDADFSELFPLTGVLDDYYTYTGSMNVPLPTCLEAVTWVIPNYVLEASTEQIELWQGRYMRQDLFNGHGNVRDLQSVGSRTVYHFVPTPSLESTNSCPDSHFGTSLCS